MNRCRHVWKKKVEGDIFRFCKKCPKRKKIITKVRARKTLYTKAYNLWRQFAYLRDGDQCMIQKVFPELNLNHSAVMNVDHFCPRGDHNLHLETSNSTVICQTCNMLKSNGSIQSTIINCALRDIVHRREGEAKFQEMMGIHNERKPNREWMREEWLAGQISKLESEISDLKLINGQGGPLCISQGKTDSL